MDQYLLELFQQHRQSPCMKCWRDPRIAEPTLSRAEVFFVSALAAFPQVQLVHSLLSAVIG